MKVVLIFANVKNSKKLVGTIELFREDALLIGQALKSSLGIHAAYLYGLHFLHKLMKFECHGKLMLRWNNFK